MNCDQCGTPNPDAVRFCNNCGTAFTLQPSAPRRPDAGYNWKLVIGVILGIFALAGVGSLLSDKDHTGPASSPSQTPPAPAAHSTSGAATKPVDVPPDRLRQQLGDDYLQVISAANPHLNYIRQKITKTKGGYALWLVHEFFTQSSFSIGSDAKLVSTWIDLKRSDLSKAKVVRVGFMNTNGYLGYCYFDLN